MLRVASIEKAMPGALQSDPTVPATLSGLSDAMWLCTSLMRAIECDAPGEEAQSDP